MEREGRGKGLVKAMEGRGVSVLRIQRMEDGKCEQRKLVLFSDNQQFCNMRL
jgi:hypothetical protein